MVIYDIDAIKESRKNLTSSETGVIAKGTTTRQVIFDIKFTLDEKMLVIATIKNIKFVVFESGQLTTTRGIYQTFSVSPGFSLSTLETKYKGENKKLMLSGMGNGSIYFWEK